MATGNALRIDALITAELGGRDKLRALIAKRAGTIQQWARNHGFYPEQVQFTLRGERPYEDVRDALAADFDLDRAEINLLLDGEPEPALTDDAA